MMTEAAMRRLLILRYLIGVLPICIAVLSLCVPDRSAPCGVESCERSLERLAVSEFTSLTRVQKLDVLNDVCRVEFSELKISHGLILNCAELDDEELAQYDEEDYTVTINEKYIDTQCSFTLVHAMCHECYHARQYELLRGHDSLGWYREEQLKEIQRTYRDELSDYCTPHENRSRYRAQTIEQDADAYADTACLKYLAFYDLSEKRRGDIRAAITADNGKQ